MALLRKDVITEPTCKVPPDAHLSQASSSLICPMAFVLSLLTTLVVFSYGPGGSLGCDLSQNHVRISRKNFMVLGQMRRISPRFCLKDRKDFGFPHDMVDGSQLPKAQATSVLHETLQQTFCLFHTERSSAAWDTSLLDNLHTGLHRQLEDLDACLVRVMGDEESALGVTGPTLAVKRYFQGIHIYLEEKKYSDCAWEIVRVEIMRALSSSTNLQERIRIMDGDLGSP
ncbi:interferon omega-1-like [Kogia breviceps]|uniref:interferon omega-1-like n=1 Tax=Kogia breviceps TaxID=27615 RepID=UPI002795985C|nr:interferon omega-1-like [Kogia breviceps]